MIVGTLAAILAGLVALVLAQALLEGARSAKEVPSEELDARGLRGDEE